MRVGGGRGKGRGKGNAGGGEEQEQEGGEQVDRLLVAEDEEASMGRLRREQGGSVLHLHCQKTALSVPESVRLQPRRRGVERQVLLVPSFSTWRVSEARRLQETSPCASHARQA